MGLDLTLLPLDSPVGMPTGMAFSHTVLGCCRRGDLFDDIMRSEKKRGVEVEKGFASYLSRNKDYEDAHYGETLETPYGEKLKHLSARDLVAFKNHADVRDNAKNRAIWAYLGELDPETRVALYWH